MTGNKYYLYENDEYPQAPTHCIYEYEDKSDGLGSTQRERELGASMNMVFMESQLGKHKTVPMSLSDERDCPGSVAAKHSLSQTFVDHSVLVLYTCWINGEGMTHLARIHVNS